MSHLFSLYPFHSVSLHEFLIFPKSSSSFPLDSPNPAVPSYCINRETVESSLWFLKRSLHLITMCSQPSQDHLELDFSHHIFFSETQGLLTGGAVVILCTLQMLVNMHNAVLICYTGNYNQRIHPCSHLLPNTIIWCQSPMRSCNVIFNCSGCRWTKTCSFSFLLILHSFFSPAVQSP